MFKKSQKNTFERYEKETGKSALTPDNKIKKAFGDWSEVSNNCTAIPQSVDKKYMDEIYPKYKAKTISKEEAVKEYGRIEAEIKRAGLCFLKGDGKRRRGIIEFAKARKEMREELGL